MKGEKNRAYNLAVEIVLLNHDGVDSLGVLKSKKAETSRAAGCTIAHDGAF